MRNCHNTRKTNPWVKVKVAIGRCLFYIRTGDPHVGDARRRGISWGGLSPDWVLFMFTNRSCLPTCYDVDYIPFYCNKEPAANTERLFADINQQHFR